MRKRTTFIHGSKATNRYFTMIQATQPAVQPEFVRAPGAARFLNVSYSHFRSLIRKGEGPPAIHLGRTKLFAVETLRKFMAAKEQ